jgi:hypothetical protein
MGQHVWLLLATIVTELLAITKWGKGQYPNPIPNKVKWGWMIGAVSLVLYPIFQVCIFHLMVHSICLFSVRIQPRLIREYFIITFCLFARSLAHLSLSAVVIALPVWSPENEKVSTETPEETDEDQSVMKSQNKWYLPFRAH